MDTMRQNGKTTSRFHEEIETWKRDLGFLQQDNIAQKNKLAEILKSGENDDTVIETAEYYQNHFLQQDEMFRLTWTDISKFEKLVNFQQNTDDHHRKQVRIQEKKLKKEVSTLESNFDKLRDEFNHFFEAIV